MSRVLGKGRLIGLVCVGLLGLLFSHTVQSQQPPYAGQYGWPSPYNPYGFRPVPDSNARGVPPLQQSAPSDGTGNTPNTYPGLGFPTPWTQPDQRSYPSYRQPANEVFPPRLQFTVSSTKVFVQQTLVLTLEVISGESLQALDPVLPSREHLAFRKIGTWDAVARIEDGRREVVNRLAYLITPLRATEALVAPIKVVGKSKNGQRFEAVAADPLRLTINPPEPGLIPWLPLESFDINTKLINESDVKDGKPVTLIVEQEAVGATGSQLPSPEPQLRAGAFRLYLESSTKNGEITRDGQLIGTRIDTYTLQPDKARQLMIPSLRFTWWNVGAQRAETVLAPSRMLNASGGALMTDLSDRLGSGPFLAGSSWVFWLPLTIFAFVTGLYWTLIWARGKKLRQRLSASLRMSLAPLTSNVSRRLARFSPQRYSHVARRRFAQLLPLNYRLWFCVRAAEEEDDPTIWSQVLRFLIQRRLTAPSQVSMPELAQIIIDIHPGTHPDRVRSLLDQLHAALYGQKPIVDFKQWKRDFKREIRPRLAIDLKKFLVNGRNTDLPSLNP